MGNPSDVTDEQRALLEPLLDRGTGRAHGDLRAVVGGIFCITKTRGSGARILSDRTTHAPGALVIGRDLDAAVKLARYTAGETPRTSPPLPAAA